MRLLGLIPYNLQRRAWTYSEILNMRDQVAAGVKTAVIAQRLSRTQDGVKGIMKAHGIRYGANRPRYWRPEEDAMLRRLAAEGESYREIARQLGSGQYGVQNRGVMLHTAGAPPARLPAGRLLFVAGLVVLQTTTGGAVRYCTPGKRPVTGRAPRPAHRTKQKKGTAREQTFPRGAFPSRSIKSDP